MEARTEPDENAEDDVLAEVYSWARHLGRTGDELRGALAAGTLPDLRMARRWDMESLVEHGWAHDNPPGDLRSLVVAVTELQVDLLEHVGALVVG